MSAERMILVAVARADLWLCEAGPYLAVGLAVAALAALAAAFRR